MSSFQGRDPRGNQNGTTRKASFRGRPQAPRLVMLFGIQAHPLSLSCQTCHSLLTTVSRLFPLVTRHQGGWGPCLLCSLYLPSLMGSLYV